MPEPLRWLLVAIVSFYFGARHQAKGQEFQVHVAQTMAQVPQVVDNLKALRALDAGASVAADTQVADEEGREASGYTHNTALSDWRRMPTTPHAVPLGGRCS